jgi:hypothetical protein
MYAAHSIPTAQFRSTRQPLQNLTPDQHIITDNMPGTPLDSHHFALTTAEKHLDRHAMVSNYKASASWNKVENIRGTATGT